MKIGFLMIVVIVSASCCRQKPIETPKLECTLTSARTSYKIGQIPEIKVGIKNMGNKDIYLMGSLDGSDWKWRMPYCYFTIEKPKPDTVNCGRCGNMNGLDAEDFVKVKAGETFNPFERIDGGHFFGPYQFTRKENFRNPGTYKIQFHYSTNSNNMDDFRGGIVGDKTGGKVDSKLQSLFAKAAKVELESNVLEIEIKP